MSGEPAERPPVLEVRLDGTAGTLAAAGAAVRAMANAAGVHPDGATRFRVVAEELVREALAREHEDGAPQVTVRIHVDGTALRVEVCDQGLPVTAAEARVSAARRLAALGFVDELHIAAHGSRGNVAECAIALGAPDLASAGEVLDDSAPDASDEEAAALDVREMDPRDAPGLARCIYRCYGYTYKDRALYEPRHIAHALRTGVMRSTVAVRPDGEVVGHSALFVQRADDRVPEAGKLVVDPRYRGHHLAERMAVVRRERAAVGGVPGFWAQAVTNHPASQAEVLHLGGAEVGVLIGASPASVVMAGLANVNEGRRTLVAMYTPIVRDERTIHLPARHHELVRAMADRLVLPRTIGAGTGSSSSHGRTQLRTLVTPETGLACIRIERVGNDVAHRVAGELDGLDVFDLGAVHLDVPVTDAAAPAAVEELERLGFSFAAWLPEFGPEGDVLRLQRTGSHPVDVDHVVCARPEGEAVRDAVVAEWRRVRRAGFE